MGNSVQEKDTLNKVNETGMYPDTFTEGKVIYVVLSPYLDQLMKLLKILNSNM